MMIPNLPVVYQPVDHVVVGKSGDVVYQEELTSVAPVLSGPGQLIDHFRMSSSRTLAVIRSGGLGDLLMLTPVLQRVHSEYPHLDMTLFCDPRYVSLMQGMDWLRVRSSDAYLGHQYEYDASVDLGWYVERSVLRTSVDRVSLFGAAFGLAIKEGRPIYRVCEDERGWAQSWMAKRTGPVIALAPWATDPRRCWREEQVLGFCERVGQAGGTTLLLHHDPSYASNVELPKGAWVLAGMDLRQVAAILEQCTAVVSVDTGIYHLASAVQRKGSPYVVMVWGMWDPRLRLKWMTNYLAITSRDVACYPCNEQFAGRCSRQCMDISADRVWEEGIARFFAGEVT